MNIDLTVRFHLNAVIQLINEYSNRPLVERIPRIYTDSPVEIIRKENGMYAFVNAQEKEINIHIELPQFLSEDFTVSAKSGYSVKMVRCTPEPLHILGAPPADMTYFCGKSEPKSRVYLLCPVKYCRIKAKERLEDGRILFESMNFLNAGTGRTVLLENGNGQSEFVRTEVDKEYSPKRFFLAKSEKIESVENLHIRPVFSARTDAEGNFLVAVSEAEDGVCRVLDENKKLICESSYISGGRVILKNKTAEGGV